MLKDAMDAKLRTAGDQQTAMECRFFAQVSERDSRIRQLEQELHGLQFRVVLGRILGKVAEV